MKSWSLEPLGSRGAPAGIDQKFARCVMCSGSAVRSTRKTKVNPCFLCRKQCVVIVSQQRKPKPFLTFHAKKAKRCDAPESKPPAQRQPLRAWVHPQHFTARLFHQFPAAKQFYFAFHSNTSLISGINCSIRQIQQIKTHIHCADSLSKDSRFCVWIT